MSVESEVTRVLNNPDHVILSDTLKDILGDTKSPHNLDNILTTVRADDFEISGNLISLSAHGMGNMVVLAVPAFKGLDAIFSLKNKDVEIVFVDNDYIISGHLNTMTLENNLEENSTNFNLTLCIESK